MSESVNFDPVSLGLESETIVTRHSKKAKTGTLESDKYPGLVDPEGPKLARERVQEIKELIDKSSKDAIIFIGGASEFPRTKSTAEVYGDEIDKIYQDNPEVVVLTRHQEDIPFDPKKGYTTIIKNLQNIVANNADKKIVINFPMFIKQLAFSYEYAPDKYRWADKKGNYTPYTEKLIVADEELAKDGRNDGGLILWLESQGVIGDIKGPSPKQVAEEYIQGLKRLQDFVKKYIGERPLIVGAVGHSWDLDALAIYLGNNGVVDMDGYKKIAKSEMIKETELINFKINTKGVRVNYKGQDFEVDTKK